MGSLQCPRRVAAGAGAGAGGRRALLPNLVTAESNRQQTRNTHTHTQLLNLLQQERSLLPDESAALLLLLLPPVGRSEVPPVPAGSLGKTPSRFPGGVAKEGQAAGRRRGRDLLRFFLGASRTCCAAAGRDGPLRAARSHSLSPRRRSPKPGGSALARQLASLPLPAGRAAGAAAPPSAARLLGGALGGRLAWKPGTWPWDRQGPGAQGGLTPEETRQGWARQQQQQGGGGGGPGGATSPSSSSCHPVP